MAVQLVMQWDKQSILVEVVRMRRETTQDDLNLRISRNNLSLSSRGANVIIILTFAIHSNTNLQP